MWKLEVQNLKSILSEIEAIESDSKKLSQVVSRRWMDFSSAIREHRKQKGLSLEDFSAKLDIGKSMLSYLETGGREWTMTLAKKATKLVL